MSEVALLVVDAQVGMFQGPRPVYRAEETLGRIAALTARARAAGLEVIYVQDDDIGGYGTPEWGLHPLLAPRPGDLRVRKLAADAFYGTCLQEELEARGVRHLVVAGFKTQFCVDATCRRAAYLGYRVTLAADAHSTSDSPHLSAQQIIAHHNALLQGMNGPAHGFEGLAGIEVLPADEVLFPSRPDLPEGGSL